MVNNTIHRISDLRELVTIYFSEEYRTWLKQQPLDYKQRLENDVIDARLKLQDVIYAFQEATNSNKENENESK